MNQANDLIKRKIMEYLEPIDLKKLSIIDKSCSLIIEDPVFWENYLLKRGRLIPKRLPTVSEYYSDHYQYKHEARKWVNYMSYKYKNVHDPGYIFKKDVLLTLNYNLFGDFPEIKKELYNIQSLLASISMTHAQASMGLFREKNIYYNVYFLIEEDNMEPSYLYEKTIIVSEEQMIHIISIFFAAGLYFYDEVNLNLLRLPWDSNYI
jgi:hypothetical protein